MRSQVHAPKEYHLFTVVFQANPFGFLSFQLLIQRIQFLLVDFFDAGFSLAQGFDGNEIHHLFGVHFQD
jgi:hypothetical protein